MGIVMTLVYEWSPVRVPCRGCEEIGSPTTFLHPVLADIAITSGIVLAQLYNILEFKSLMIVMAVAKVAVLTVQGYGIIMPNEVRLYMEPKKGVPDK